MTTGVEIWLVRHGKSELNIDKRKIYRGANSWSELTHYARNQSKELGERWKQCAVQIDLWLCSPTVRAQQTCRFCQEGRGINWPCFELTDEIIELRQGEAEGKDHSQYGYVLESGQEPVFLTPGISTDADYWKARLYSRLSHKPVAGAESQYDVYQRAERFLRMRIGELAASLEASNRRLKVAVFTHENVIKCLLIGLKLHPGPYMGIILPNLSVTRLEYSDGKWRALDATTNNLHSP